MCRKSFAGDGWVYDAHGDAVCAGWLAVNQPLAQWGPHRLARFTIDASLLGVVTHDEASPRAVVTPSAAQQKVEERAPLVSGVEGEGDEAGSWLPSTSTVAAVALGAVVVAGVVWWRRR